MIERSVMGILLVAVDLAPENDGLLESANIPFIFISMTMKNTNFPFISSNDFDIGYQATKYLIKHGHQKLALRQLTLIRSLGIYGMKVIATQCATISCHLSSSGSVAAILPMRTALTHEALWSGYRVDRSHCLQ